MGQMYIEEAFKRLNLLEDDYSYSEDQQLELLNSFVSDDIDDIPEEEIIDVEAETCDDLQDNYIGKVIIECDCCHTRLYKDQEDLILGSSEDGVELFNVDEECPVCHTTSGYRVIGKIEQYSDDAHKEDEEEHDEEPEEEVEKPEEVEEPEDDDFEEEVHEALKEALDGDRCVAVLNKNEFDETGDAEAIAAKIESDYIPGNGELETLSIECEAQGDNIIFTGPKIDIDELYNRMFPEGITPDYVECSLDESADTVEFNSKEDAKKYYDEHRNELQDYKSFEDWFESGVEKLDEALNSVEVKTDEGNVIVEKTDDKLVVDLSSEDDLDVDDESDMEDPDLVDLDNTGDEMIAPLSNEEEDDILDTAELNAEEKEDEESEEEDVDDFDNFEEEPEEEDTGLPDLDEVDEEETEEDEEEVEESLHESLSDRLKARLASMSSKGGDEEDDEPLDEELTRSEKARAVIQYLIDRPDKKQYSDDDIRQAYKEYEEKKNASKESHDEDDHEDDDEQFDESLSDDIDAEFDEADDDDELEIDDLEDFNESTFNKICESYLRRVYENVNGFKCTRVKSSNNKLMVEGVINFVSGNSKQTTFEFSKPTVTKRGKVVLEGLNKTFTNTQNAYILKGYVKDKEFISESMIYRYTAKTINESNQQESVKFYGRVVYK